MMAASSRFPLLIIALKALLKLLKKSLHHTTKHLKITITCIENLVFIHHIKKQPLPYSTLSAIMLITADVVKNSN